MREMHGVLETGEVVKGVEVFRRSYDMIGLGWVWRITALPVLRPFFDRMYSHWATYRTSLTRGVALDDLIKKRNDELRSAVEKREKEGGDACEDGSCKVKIRD
jgi:hypothetical protein